MKKAIFIVLCLMLAVAFCTPAHAEHWGKRARAKVEKVHNVVGAKLDAPNLIRFNKDWTLGSEISKDILQNAFYANDSLFEDDLGYAVYVKITYTGTWLDFSN